MYKAHNHFVIPKPLIYTQKETCIFGSKSLNKKFIYRKKCNPKPKTLLDIPIIIGDPIMRNFSNRRSRTIGDTIIVGNLTNTFTGPTHSLVPLR